MQINKNNRIFVAGHKGMVGAAVVKYLKKKKLQLHHHGVKKILLIKIY